MEDVTDIGFRMLCKRFGAAMVYTEFVSAEALVRDVKSTVKKLTISDEERPVGIQIYGRDVDAMVEAAKIVEQAGPDLIDLNFGCPVKKVAGKGAGAGMLQNIPKMLEITQKVVQAQDESDRTWIHVAIETIGYLRIETIILGDGEHVNWTLIGEVKRNPRIHIPIIGNGDIKSLDDADKAFDTYGVDAVMIGRATFGCPWIFSREELTLSEKIDILKEQLRINIEHCDTEEMRSKGKSAELCGILHTRRHLAASPIFKGIPNFRETRIAMLRAEKTDDLLAILEACRQRLG